MTTDVQIFEGNVALTLYDYKGNASEKEMLLAEKKCAEMISCSQACRFNFLNQETNLYNMNAQNTERAHQSTKLQKAAIFIRRTEQCFFKSI
jgi:hypothetical protein